jgi:hypothetical protein
MGVGAPDIDTDYWDGGAGAFNQPIGSWNTARVTVMERMFNGARAFDQNIASWNTAAVVSMHQMFNCFAAAYWASGASAFKQDISGWNVQSVTSLGGVFDSTQLVACTKRRMYDAWGSTLQAAYPTWVSVATCTPVPSTRSPTTASQTALTQSPRGGIVATGTPTSQAPIIAVVAPSASPSKASPTASSQQMLLTTAPGNATVTSSGDAKAIAGGIGGAVAAVLLVVGAVILRKTCRKLKAKDAAKPDASTHELQRKDRAEALKLGAGASLATNAPWLRLVTAGRSLQVGRWLLRLRPPLCFQPDSMQRWRSPRRSARYICPIVPRGH